MSKKPIIPVKDKKRLTNLAAENVKLLENENQTVDQLEKVRANLDEIISLIDSAIANKDKK